MYAASKGLYANYIDSNAIRFSSFVKLGLNKGLKREERTYLSQFMRDSGDITFYRHYHGPLYIYFLSFAHGLFEKNELLIRWSSLIFWAISVAVAYFGCLFLMGKEGRRPAILASAFLLFSSTNILTCSQISPHGLYALMVMITLLFLSKFLKTKQLKFFYLATVSTALAFLTIEYALLLLLTLISCVWLHWKNVFFGLSHKDRWIRGILIPAGLFFGIVFVLWPSAWLKLSLIKNYMFHAYFALIRGNEYSGVYGRPFWQAWLGRFSHFPVEYLLILPATGIALFKLRFYKWYIPFLIYPFLMLMTTFRNTSVSPTYISSLLPPLYILSGIIISDIIGKASRCKRTVSVILIVFGLLGSCWFHHYHGILRENSDQPQKNITNYIDKNELHNGKILIDRNFIPTLHYYFPDKAPPSYRKANETFDTIITKLGTNSYTGIIFADEGDRVAFEKRLQRFFVYSAKFITVHDTRDIIHYKLEAKR